MHHLLMASRPEIIQALHHYVPTSRKSSLLPVLAAKDNWCTNDVIINRSPILLHINFIRGHSTIQQESINGVVPKASENPYH